MFTLIFHHGINNFFALLWGLLAVLMVVFFIFNVLGFIWAGLYYHLIGKGYE